ncbi:MAG: tetratricopeptide repeat protein, partial [Muribaculum sp.]|nr:tetratricopeptide repeat protein [Muribaculum sp.]
VPQAMLEKAESQIALNHTDDALATYRLLIKKYPSTRPGRNGALQLAITLMSAGRRGDAVKAYKNVIKAYPTSQEAVVASDDLKRILSDDGKLKEYVAFINSVPSAPKLEASEMDELTFASAEKSYLAGGSVQRLVEYIEEYPGGAKEPQALGYLASAFYEAQDYDKAYDYASRLVTRYPDAEEAEEALAIKGDVEWMNGRGNEALASFTALAEKASASRNVLIARLGIMRVARDMGRNEKVLEMADAILASSNGGNAQRNEVVYSRGLALSNLGKTDDAAKVWDSLSGDLNDVYGVQAAFRSAQLQVDSKQYKSARRSLQKIIDSNTPHQYWLARAYILLSDVYRAQGNTFEANEYLKSLRDNYPGTESDIFEMINERLDQ